MMEKSYRVQNLDCANCAAKIERAAKKLDDVEKVNVNFMTQRLTLSAPESRHPELIKEINELAGKIEPGTKVIG